MVSTIFDRDYFHNRFCIDCFKSATDPICPQPDMIFHIFIACIFLGSSMSSDFYYMV
jgi:hypothetical protein